MTTTTRSKQIDKGDGYKVVLKDGVMMVKYADGTFFVPRPSRYEGFAARDFADLRRELVGSGIKADVADLWVNQAQGVI